ncbi:hypothetical protein [Nitratireductor sp. GZWM139]|uniref:hypothetical protein n=1 Tax=Nitratireductor sp. GZWM139 TaxID=2950541 RepID=UPI0024BDC538|nr:hypothetical protein [Nitratireductor sp. GZWM139]MDJ1466064.1 hypothetical protein [Nitratireductor sp. GZWM139]
MRSIAAAARAAERDAQRRHKQNQKEQMIADSTSAVEDWENYIDNLVSIHTDMADMIDWHTIAGQPRPSEPFKRNDNSDRAAMALAKFKPSFFHALRGGSAKLRSRLEAQIEEAAVRDRKQYEDALTAHAKAVAEWEDDTALAKRLVTGEATAIRQVIEEMQSLSETALVGTAIEFSIDRNFVHAKPKVHGDDIVPSMRRKQLASGRLSETKMPVGQFNELYQDYVASAALKTAGDLFHILPLEEIYVTCTANMLNSQTGHQEWTPILSVQFVRDSFMRLNLSSIDPSDSMRNFRHAMKFSKTKGFAAIEPLEPVTANQGALLQAP